MRLRVNFDPELAGAAKKVARQSDCTVSALIYNIVAQELLRDKTETDRTTVVLEYVSIQLDLILAHLNPELKKKARDVFKARKTDASLPLMEAGNAL